MEDERIYQLAFQFMNDIGVARSKLLISYCGSAKAVFSSTTKSLKKIPGIGKKTIEKLNFSEALKKAKRELVRINNEGITIHFYLDEDFPQRLKLQEDSPILIYSRGHLDWRDNKTVAIIGTRSPSDYGITQVASIVKNLKPHNPIIISGLAYGVDTEAHKHAVEQGLQTVGVLGSGINNVYPASNKALVLKMMKHGGIISEFKLDTVPEKVHFPMRNRIIAALADVVIVVESQLKGGSYITCQYANEYSKDVFALPGRISDQKSLGCNHLIKTHKAHLFTSVEDIKYICRWDKPKVMPQMELNLDLSATEKHIFKIFSKYKKLHIERLIQESDVSLSELSSVLLNLELKGIIKSMPGKHYILLS